MDRPQTGLRRDRPAFRFHTKFPPTDTLAYAFLVRPRAKARPRALLSCPHSVSLRHILRQPDYGTLVANWKLVVHGLFRRRRVVRKEFLIGMIIVALAFMATACSSTPDANTNTNAAPNTNASPADLSVTTLAPDNSEITTTTNNGAKTETRTFKSNPRVSKVVVTTNNGNRTVKVYSA